jgi:hypothetical protein
MEAFILASLLLVFVWVLTTYLNPVKVIWWSFILYAACWFISVYFQLSTFHYSGYFFLPASLIMAIRFKLAEEMKMEGVKNNE